jgi:catechol 2,3-dioxygenase-like lactoylglutathione lyase family enzyme
MGFHHVAVACRDTAATHDFYTRVMGFELVKVVAGPTPSGKGWSKHLFYGTGSDGMIAFWELHDPEIGEAYPTDLNVSLGLPQWVNHLAFDAPTMDDLVARREHWRSCGITVAEVDHEFCVSIYTMDPNGTMVEWCWDTRVLDENDRAEAEALLHAEFPELSDPPRPVFHRSPATAS